MNIDKMTQEAVEALAYFEERKAKKATKQGRNYKPKITHSFYNDHAGEKNDKILQEAIKQLDIDYVDSTWQKADWIATFLAGTIGSILDILITQTKVLKPIDSFVREILSSPQIKSLQDAADAFSNKKRDWQSAPIDFQNFEMAGFKNIHEQYSFGHDPVRFIEGIFQMMTGEYRGVDKYGRIIRAPFGEKITNPIQAVISYVAHMVSDMCNQQGLPYPGSTFIMQFGSDETRKKIAAAYRTKAFNARIFIYQSLPMLFTSLIIHAWAIFDNYTHTKKIKLLIGDNIKYQSMLLASNAMIATSNLTITAVRGYLGDSSAIFRINWPTIINTIRLGIKYLRIEDRQINEMDREADKYIKQLNIFR